LHRIERRPDGIFERLFRFRGGEGSAPHVAHQPRHGNLGPLVMVPVPLQNHPGVEDVVVPVLEILQAALDFFLPLRDHCNVAALGPNVHAASSGRACEYRHGRSASWPTIIIWGGLTSTADFE